MDDLDRATHMLGYNIRDLFPVELAFARADLALIDPNLDATSLLVKARSWWNVTPMPARDLETHPSAPIAALATALSTVVATKNIDEPNASDEFRAPATSAANEETHTSITLVKWDSPSDEAEGMARSIQAATRRASHPIEGAGICVVAPNRQWAALAERALKHRRFDVAMPRTRLGFAHNPQDAAKAKELVAYNKLRLLADSSNAAAWRVWLGIGKTDLASHAWTSLLEHAKRAGIQAIDALFALDDPMAFPDAAFLMDRRDEGLSFVDKKSELRGYSLVSAIEADELPEFEEALSRLEPNDHAAELLSHLHDAYLFPSFEYVPEEVRVATYDTLMGMYGRFDMVWLIACVDGLVGDGDESVGTACGAAHPSQQLFADICALANRELVISYFAHAPLDVARKAKMRFARTRLIDGMPSAMLKPSPYLLKAGHALPGTIGGQAYLASL